MFMLASTEDWRSQSMSSSSAWLGEEGGREGGSGKGEGRKEGGRKETGEKRGSEGGKKGGREGGKAKTYLVVENAQGNEVGALGEHWDAVHFEIEGEAFRAGDRLLDQADGADADVLDLREGGREGEQHK